MTSSTNGNANTCGCRSPSRKLKKGNSSITSWLAPERVLSWMTREARHHHQLSPGYQVLLAGAPARFFTSSQR